MNSGDSYTVITAPESLDFLFEVYVAPHEPNLRRQDILSAKVYNLFDNPRRLEFFDEDIPGETPVLTLCPTLGHDFPGWR